MEFIEPKADEDIEAKVRELATDKMKRSCKSNRKIRKTRSYGCC